MKRVILEMKQVWLTTPENNRKVLWESTLEPEINEDTYLKYTTRPVLSQEDLSEGLPKVSIGEPEKWKLTKIYPSESMPLPLKDMLEEADIYLVRFVCTFRPDPDHKENKVDWARFTTCLLPDENGRQPIALDLYPKDIFYEVKKNIKVVISPTIKFHEIEGSIGEVELGLEYSELLPIVSANCIGESNPSWDYEEFKGLRVQGSKCMYMLLKAPKKMRPIYATLELKADIRIKDWLLPGVLSRQKEASKALERVKIVD